MKVLIVDHEQVRQLLPMKECINGMQEMFETMARGEAILPLRQMLRQPDQRGLLAVMPGFLGNPKAIGAKVITVFPGNLETRYDSHQGAVLLFETENGRLLSINDATSITATRTAAVSAVATRALARKDSSTVAILGSGTQALKHVEAMLAVLNIKKFRVWSRNRDHASRMARKANSLFDLKIEETSSAREAVTGADVICTTTSAKEPILNGEWIAEGAHINAVGYFSPSSRELDSEAVARSSLFVDRRESTINEAGEFRMARDEGKIDDSHIKGEIGDVLIGKVPGRRDGAEITLFRSLGIATEDVAATMKIYKNSLSKNIGNWVEFSAEREV